MTRTGEQFRDCPSDGDLLAQFVATRQQEAFAQLVHRRGPMVLGVCRAVLGKSADAKDVGQAVFLTLAQRAHSLKDRATLVGWLHRVAWYIATRAAEAARTRRRHEREAALMKQDAPDTDETITTDLVHAEIERLPEKYRLAMLLHHLEGRTEAETAGLLVCTKGKVSMRLSRGRQMLRERLQRRGVNASEARVTTAMASQAAVGVSASFAAKTSQAALHAITGKAVAGSATAAMLSKNALSMLFWAKVKLAMLVTAVLLLAGGTATATYVLAVKQDKPIAPKEPALTSLPASEPATPILAEWTIDNQQRQALIIPPRVQSPSGAPVILIFHEHGGTMQAMAKKGFQTAWPEAIVVCPQGLPGVMKEGSPEWRRFPEWQVAEGENNDRDLNFFDAMLQALHEKYNIDDHRIYATGHSNGGTFVYLLWTTRDKSLAAIAASGATFRTLGLVKNLAPLPVMHIAGEEDPSVAFAIQQRTMDMARKINHCDNVGQRWATSGDVVATLYPSKEGAPFVEAVFPGAHEYPGPQLIVKFFQQQVKK